MLGTDFPLPQRNASPNPLGNGLGNRFNIGNGHGHSHGNGNGNGHANIIKPPVAVEATMPLTFPTFEIDFAFQGQEGLERVRKALAQERPYTMAFVDMRMPPGWNGIETISRIWKECFDLQIVICTGYSDFSWHDLIRQFGHSDRLLVLKKPFDMTEVRQVAYSLAEKWDLAHQAMDHLQRLQKLVSERTASLQEANHSLQRKIIENKAAERRLLTQYSVSRALAQAGTLDAAIDTIFQIVCQSLDWDWGGFWQVDAKANVLRLTNHWNAPDAAHEGFSALSRETALERGAELPGRVWGSGQAAWLRDVFLDAGSKRAAAASQNGLHGAIAFPICAGTKMLGVMEFLSREIREREKDMLQTFTVIGSAIGQFSERRQAEVARGAMEIQLRHAQKMESIGHLAAGIAHEINTPTQYLGDNIRFLQSSFGELRELHINCQQLIRAARENTLTPALLAAMEGAASRANIDFLLKEIPEALRQSLDGVERVTRIVRAMKDFSHPGTGEKTPIDLNKAIETTLTVARNEWKYVAKIVTEFDPQLPKVPCLPGEFNQVILNLVVNAAHAIGDVVGDGAKGMGIITASTRQCDDRVEIRIRDTGTGIPEKIRGKIFDPFFTTKPVGKGTGQGLAISHAVVVDQHGGQLTFETEMGVGTVFIIRLPLNPAPRAKKEAQP
jgi:signal transduction histidine kinase